MPVNMEISKTITGYIDDNRVYESSSNIIAQNLTISSSADVTMGAPGENRLKTGFQAKAGSKFTTEISPSNGEIITNIYYTYDAEGNRIKKLQGSNSQKHSEYGKFTICYVRDNSGRIRAAYNSKNQLQHINLYGTGLVGRYDATNGEYYYYLKDHIGNIRAVANGSDNSGKEAYDYYPYGLPMTEHKSGTETQERFTGKELDEEGGVDNYYFGARYYDPSVCMWTTADPAGQYYSPYVYGAGNPVIGVDENGEWFWAAAYYAYKAYKIYSMANMAYQMVDAYQQGGFDAMLQTGAAMGASYIVGNAVGGAIGSSGLFGTNMAGTIASGAIGGAITGGTVSTMFGGSFSDGAVSGGIGGGLNAGISWMGQHAGLNNKANALYGKGDVIGDDPVPIGIDREAYVKNLGEEQFKWKFGTRGWDELEIWEKRLIRNNEEVLGRVTPNYHSKANSFLERLIYGARGSKMSLSPTIFNSRRQVFLTLGHELIHVNQIYNMGWANLKSELQSNAMEEQAYGWAFVTRWQNDWRVTREIETQYIYWVNSPKGNYVMPPLPAGF